MALIPLRSGPLAAAGFIIQRSGIRWLREDGHLCRDGEAIAYCNIGLRLRPGVGRPQAIPFAEETRDFQIAFATPCAGRLRRGANVSHGGFIDRQSDFLTWGEGFEIGHLETDAAISVTETLRLNFLAGRRVTEIAEIRSGLLTGWHDRSRAWWGEGGEAPGTLLSAGICELAGVVRGERSAFLEWFDAAPGPAQVVFLPDTVLVPCARVLTEQLRRNTADRESIAADFARSFLSTGITPGGQGWIFAGALLAALLKSPLSERYDILSRDGIRQVGPADAILLSLNAETQKILRHKRLGFHMKCHGFRLAETGPATRAWLQANFDTLPRSIDDVRRDYLDFIDTVRAKSDRKILITNVLSSSGTEDIQNYAPFDRPLGKTLGSVHAKELNLMLYDLARERQISIVDIDAIAADLGAASNLPDGVHGSGAFQNEARREILRILHALRIPGFAPMPAVT